MGQAIVGGFSMKRILATTGAVAVAALAAAAAAAAPTLTLTAAPTLVVYGKTTTLSGQLTPPQANQNITIEAQACGTTNFKKVTNVRTAANGSYTTTATPTGQTTYRATEHGATSNTVVVKVKKGVYKFVCDPHASTMKGSFKVL